MQQLRSSSGQAKSPLSDHNGWRMVKFGEMATNVNERVDDPSRAGVDRYVGLEHLDPESLKIARWGKPTDVEATKLRFYPGDIIFGKRRFYQRKLAVADFEGICSAHALVLRAKEDVVQKDFLPFFMQSDQFFDRAMMISVGGLSPTIDWSTLARQEFAVPPKPEQRRIAEILWAAEDHENALGRLQDACARTMQSTLDAFLGRGTGLLHDRPRARDGWNTETVGDLILDGPRNGFSPQAETLGRGLPTLSLGAIREGQVVPDGNLKYADVLESDIKDYLLRPQDILVVRGNGNRDLVGRCGVVTALPPRCFYPDLLILLRFNEEKIRQRFAALQWNHTEVHRRLLRKAKSTSGIWKVNGKDLRSHTLLVPPVAMQDEFLARYQILAEMSERSARMRAAARSLRNSMSARLLGPVVSDVH